MKKFTILLLLMLFLSSAIIAQKVYWIDGVASKIQSVNTDGSSLSTVLAGIKAGVGVAIDGANSNIYYTDMENKTINKTTFAGSNSTIVSQVAGSIVIPRGIAINTAADWMYWADNGAGAIKRAHLNGSSVTNFVTSLVAPSYIAFDHVGQKLYWVDNGDGVKTISRCDNDGSNIQIFVSGLSNIGGIALDLQEGYLFWADNGIDKIQKKLLTDANPANKTDVLTDEKKYMKGLFVDGLNRILYWAAYDSVSSTASIYKTNLNTLSTSTLTGSLVYPQGVAMTYDAAFPVELVSFTSKVHNNSVLLNWETKSEQGFQNFLVEKRNSSNTDWLTIGEVPSKGNSNTPTYYSYKDIINSNGRNLIYRLKMIDVDGSFSYSNEVTATLSVPEEFALNQNYPNPFNPSTNISYRLKERTFVELKVFDMTGKEVLKLVSENQDAGYYNIKLDVSNEKLSSGVYFYKLIAGSIWSSVKKLIIMK